MPSQIDVTPVDTAWDSATASSRGKSNSDTPSSSELVRYQKTRDTFLSSIGGSTKLHAMPMAGSAIFSLWHSGFNLDLRGNAWRPYGKYICEYDTTDLDDLWISACSADLATALIKCARANSEACKNQLLGSDGRKLLQQNLGCELYHRMVKIYNPAGVRATWDNNASWSKIVQLDQEPIESMANRITESSELLDAGSGGLIPVNDFSNKLRCAPASAHITRRLQLF